MKFAAFLSIVIIATQVSGQTPSNGSGANRDTTKFEQIFLYGLQGNLSQGLRFLDSLDPLSLTPRQIDLRQKYFARFSTVNEVYDYRTSDTAVKRVIDMYHTYWRKGLLSNDSIASFDTLLADTIAGFLQAHDAGDHSAARLAIRDDFPRYLSEYLRTRTVYSATGKTGMFFDLLLHTRETEAKYEVRTPEETVQVKVIFMEDAISNGWEEYATFGKYFPGGCATDEVLYCAKETYDTASENFTVSYLKHEAKHFADYKRFPKLSGTDLEYRAKLVELSAAQKSLYDLIESFSRNSGTDRKNPHAFANHCVIRDLSNACGIKSGDAETVQWKDIPMAEIHTKAEQLLKKNNSELATVGADTVTTVLK